MKKTMQFLLVIGMLMACPVMNAQNKALDKALKKEYKAKKKELEKGGWEIFGSSRSIDVTLLKHYEQLNENENLIIITGLSGAFNQKSLGRDKAAVNAQTAYARQASSVISGRFISEAGSASNDVESEFEKFSQLYEGAVMKEIKNEMIESYSVIRQIETTATGKPVYEMQSYYIVDNAAAKQARLKALRECLRETEKLQKYSNLLEKLVSEDITQE